MDTIHYLVTKIQGDYAILMPVDQLDGPENPVALAFLPDRVAEGVHLLWENLEYTVLGERP